MRGPHDRAREQCSASDTGSKVETVRQHYQIGMNHAGTRLVQRCVSDARLRIEMPTSIETIVRTTACQMGSRSAVALAIIWSSFVLFGGVVPYSSLLDRSAKASPQPDPDTSQAVSPTAQKYLIKGVTEAQLNDQREAIRYFETALSEAPQNPALLQALADAHAARGETATALFYGRKARTHGSHRPYYHRRLAELQRKAGERENALRTYQKMRTRFPDYTPTYRALAALQSNLGRPHAAIATYKSLLNSRSSLPTSVYQRLLALYQQVEDQSGTEQMLRVLLERRPANRHYRRQLGMLYAETDSPTQALDLLAPLARQHPNDSTLRARVRRLATRTGRSVETPERSPTAGLRTAPSLSTNQLVRRARILYNDPDTLTAQSDTTRLHRAETLLQTAVDRTPEAVAAWSLLAQVRGRLGNAQAAGDALKRSLDVNPRDAGRWARAASAYLQSRRYNRAVTIAEEGLLLFPGHVPLAQTAAVARLHAGQLRQARKHFQTALSLVDTSTQPTRAAMLHAGLGLAHTKLDRPTDADAALRTAQSLAPDHPVVLRRHAYSLALRGIGLDRALRKAQRAVEHAPESALALDVLGWIHLQRNALDTARRILQDALDAAPPSPRALNHYGDLERALGNDRAARSYWQRALDQAPDRTSIQKKLDTSSPS